MTALVFTHSLKGVKYASIPDPSEFGSVVMAIDDVVQNLQDELPEFTVFHQRDGAQRLQKCCGQASTDRFTLKP